MAEVEAAGQIPEARSVASRHPGYAGRDARETATGRLCQLQMDRRPQVTTKRMQKKTLKPVVMEDYEGLLSDVISLIEEARRISARTATPS